MRASASRLCAATVVLLLAATAGTAAAAPRAGTTVNVTIQNFVFSPSPITVDVGDTIRWTNLDSAPHSAVSIQPGFVTVTLAQGQSTTTTFDRPGSFEYVCGVHGVSMKGTVVVRGTPVDTPRASEAVGHVVDSAYEEARPDRLAVNGTGGALFLGAAAVLALAVIVRFAWLLRRA